MSGTAKAKVVKIVYTCSLYQVLTF